ncbi:MAG: RsmB/NOP family class I SAM-dependent RNA methyltransferase [Angustibacter sp.]
MSRSGGPGADSSPERSGRGRQPPKRTTAGKSTLRAGGPQAGAAKAGAAKAGAAKAGAPKASAPKAGAPRTGARADRQDRRGGRRSSSDPSPDGKAAAAGPRQTGTGSWSAQRPAERARQGDPARLVAFDVLRAVAQDDAYANLVLPRVARERRLTRQDAAFATELTYGTLRLRGRYDPILAACVDRPLDALDAGLVDALRVGAHQLLAMRVPPHAAVSQTVGVVRQRLGAGPGSLANAVLRRVADQDLDTWLATVAPPRDEDLVAHLAVTHSHPPWVVRAMRESLAASGVPPALRDDELVALLDADNQPPVVTLVARPGLVDVAQLRAAGAGPGRWSPYAATWERGDPGGLAAVRDGRAGVQDEGSQLVAIALAEAPLAPESAETPVGSAEASLPLVSAEVSVPTGSAAVPAPRESTRPSTRPSSGPPDARWLDLCAGPGGKTALLAALAQERGAHVVAVELAAHRARLVEAAVAGLPPGSVTVREADGRDVGGHEPGRYDRVLVDVPCTGLGALRRRPEARWRRTPSDLTTLAPLQRALLASALDAVRPGGVVGYVTCSPHPAETRLVVADVLRRRDDVEVLDAGPLVPLPGAGSPTIQLWPHRHGTDAMYLALLRRRPRHGPAAASAEGRVPH